MPLILTIENADRLPDGGPVRVEVNSRGLDIGRDQHLDWTLPDPSRTISGKHCEVRFYDGAYWLHDVSSNGTFVNGAEYRVEGPHRLKNGDRVVIGHYVIGVSVAADGPPVAPSHPAEAPAGPQDPWGGGADVAPPVDRRDLMESARAPRSADFLDWASSLATPQREPVEPPPPARPPPEDTPWLRPAPPPVAAPPRETFAPPARDEFAPVPTPARPPRHISDDMPPPSSFGEPATSSNDAALLQRIARAAGLPESALSGRDPGAVADEIGAVLRLTAANLAQMLASRAETKSLMRSSSRTMIRPAENNPLKFTTSPEEALRIMFGPRGPNYLDARTAVEASFADLKSHQLQTFSAMQSALEALFQELAPDQIDRSVEADRGLGAMVGSRKGKLWDAYVERWRGKTMRNDGRLVEAFMLLFAEAYDRLQSRQH